MTNPPPTNVDNCAVCGVFHYVPSSGETSCAGHTPCRRRRVRGEHCRAHADLATAKADLAAAQLGPVAVQPVRDPLGRLSMLAGRLESWLAVAEQRLAQALTFGDEQGRLRAEVRAFNALASRLAYLLSIMAKLDLDEERIRLDRLQADQLRELVEETMRDPELALTPAQHNVWRAAFARAARRRVVAHQPAELEGEAV